MSNDITGIGDVFNFGSKVLDKIFPDKNEAEKNKLVLLQMAQDGQFKDVQQYLDDIKDARNLASQDIAGGNNLTRFLSATFRPVAGYFCLIMVVRATLVHIPLDPLTADLCKTVFEFYFGGRVVEKIIPHLSAAVSSFGRNK